MIGRERRYNREERDSRNSSKETLVGSKENFRDATGIGATNVPEADVVEVTNEGAAAGGEGQGVAPEPPLDSGDGVGEHDHDHQGQGRLATGQTGVEEANARDHEQYQGSGDAHPGDVAFLEREGLLSQPFP